jgi:hypothetical protein
MTFAASLGPAVPYSFHMDIDIVLPHLVSFRWGCARRNDKEGEEKANNSNS